MEEKKTDTVVFNPRFKPEVDEKLRDRIYRRGELLSLIILILKTVDLSTIPLVEIGSGLQNLAATTVELPSALHAKLKHMASKRRSSMNVLMNSAVLAYAENDEPQAETPEV